MNSKLYTMPASLADPLHRGQIIAGLLAWLAIAVIFLNAGYYIHTTSNPLVSSDAWHFVDTFVGKALDGTASVGDLFAKRDGFDHAQPLNKLFLLVNARYLGLDFVYEALIGLVFALFGFLVMKRAVDESWGDRRRDAAYYLPVVALAAVYVSLNSSMVFSWPLVTFGYVTNFFLLVTILLAWHAFITKSVRWYLPALALCLVVTDDAGRLVAIAISFALILYGASSRRLPYAFKLVVLTLAMSAAYFFFYTWLDTTPRGVEPGANENIRLLFGITSGPDAWKLLIPFASSVAYFGQLLHTFPKSWETVQTLLGSAMVIAHAWFWWRSLRDAPNAPGFVAISLMLLFYAYVAGILYGRVASAGLSYLNEPRYVALYQLSVVALLLRVLASAQMQAVRWEKKVTAIAAALLILLQLPLSQFTWWEAKFNRQYWRTMASQTGQLAREPSVVPTTCVANLVICQWPEDQRTRNLTLLRRYQLNLFSADFQRRHELYPN